MKTITLFLFLFFASSSCYSQLFIENFEYPDQTRLNTTSMWAPIGDTTNQIIVSTTSLQFPDYVGSALGNAAVTGFAGEDDSAYIGTHISSGSVYASFMFQPINCDPNGGLSLALLEPGFTSYGFLNFYAKNTGSGTVLGISKVGDPTITYSGTVLPDFETYLVVVKYTFNPGGGTNDEISLFFFDENTPVPSTEPTPNIGPLTPGFADATSISTVAIYQSGNNAIIDGIYIDVSWNNNVLPVELASFTSSVSERNVTLNWTTASENNNSIFEIERKSGGSSWTTAGSVNGNGTTSSSSNYSFTDRGLSTGKYDYRLKQIDFNGNFEYFNLNNEVVIGLPQSYSISQNYPNPFNPSTNLEFGISELGFVTLKIYD
ncbi:MAG: hypothetical protein KDD00_15725, partial [Ignavibacteriae bacterium]|nr:hypothetical protein [Ignavibacteriota bacterium]